MGELGKTMGPAIGEQQPVPTNISETPHTRRRFLDRFFRRPAVARVAAGLAGAVGITSESVLAAPPPEVQKQVIPLDFSVNNGEGYFYRQTNGMGDNPDTNNDLRGFLVENDSGVDSIKFWSEFERLGGVAKLGYPITHRYVK